MWTASSTPLHPDFQIHSENVCSEEVLAGDLQEGGKSDHGIGDQITTCPDPRRDPSVKGLSLSLPLPFQTQRW